MFEDDAPTRRIRVLCVDDHPMVLEGLATIVGYQADMELVGTAASGEEAVASFGAAHPDVTIMDLQLPGMSGLQTITAIRAQHPDARIVVLTMFEGEEDIRNALRAGAVTYLLKDVRSDEILQIIRDVDAGQHPIPPSVARLLRGSDDHSQLTSRETQVLTFISEGMRNKEIGAALNISDETVKSHVKNILTKLDVGDRIAAVKVALKRGTIHLRR